MDARLALIIYAVLLSAAAGPIAVGWLALLPHEREPFAAPDEQPEKKDRDPFAIFLLANVSLSLLLRLPGADYALHSLGSLRWVSGTYADQAVMIAFIWFGFVPGLAAAYSAVRANPIRWPLLVGCAPARERRL